MIFYGNGILLLSKDKKIRFDISKRKSVDEPGQYETNDKYECNKLIKLGYKYSGELPQERKPTQRKPRKPEQTKLELVKEIGA